LETGENRIADPDLAEYYETLHGVIAGPLFSVDRLGDILRLNLGMYDHLIEAYVDALPRRISLAWLTADAEVSRSSVDRAVTIPSTGIRVELDRLSHARQILVHLDRNVDYQVIFERDGEEVTRRLLSSSIDDGPTRIGISAKSAREAYDAIAFYPADEPGERRIYSVTLLED